MDIEQKLALSGQLMSVEPAEEVNGLGVSPKDAWIQPARLPGGRCISLLKSLLSSACEWDCAYCAFRAGRDERRVSFTPDEFARAASDLAQRGQAEGVFLSSGLLGGGVRTQDRLLATAELLRGRHAFRGYLHLKLMPGAETAQIARAMQLADRLSINLEAPNAHHLSALAPHKPFRDLVRPLREAERLRRQQGGGPSLVTQFVVGASDETDRELLSTVAGLKREVRLARVYFSTFRPVAGTPLQEHRPGDGLRTRRLYQSDFMLRQYGFSCDELVFDEMGHLPLTIDPKLAWARLHLRDAPVELNTAELSRLLRVPGIGPRTAQVILRERRRGRLREGADLRKLGVPLERAAAFILLDGKRPPRQLCLWPED